MNSEKNTNFVDVLGKHYCAYCLCEMKENHGYDDGYYYWSVEYCECDDAQKQLKLEDELKSIQGKLDTHISDSYKSPFSRNDKKYIKWEAATKVMLLTNEIKLLEDIMKR